MQLRIGWLLHETKISLLSLETCIKYALYIIHSQFIFKLICFVNDVNYLYFITY